VLPEPERPKKDGGHDHPSLKAWKATIKDHGKLLHTRRRIAHHPVEIRVDAGRSTAPLGLHPVGLQTIGLGQFEPARSWFAIYVNQHERLRENSANLPPLLLQDLKNHLVAVNTLRDRLRKFYHEILTTPAGGRPPPSPPPASEKS
jgi:hypothetical protein